MELGEGARHTSNECSSCLVFPLPVPDDLLCVCLCSTQASLPANTNVLFVNLGAIQSAVQSSSQQRQQEEKQCAEQSSSCSASASAIPSLPGMIMNLKKKVSFIDDLGRDHRQAG